MFYNGFNEDEATSQKTKLLMQIRNDYPEKEIIHYLYGNRNKPLQITAIFSTRHGWIKLYHDDNDNLFAMLKQDQDTSNKKLYYIITDISGTPTHILNSTGKSSKLIETIVQSALLDF